jgi:hypothetical protein
VPARFSGENNIIQYACASNQLEIQVREGLMNLALMSDEEEMLVEILEEHYRELLLEIARTDHREYKVDLRRREQVLKSVLNKLSGATSARKAG